MGSQAALLIGGRGGPVRSLLAPVLLWRSVSPVTPVLPFWPVPTILRWTMGHADILRVSPIDARC